MAFVTTIMNDQDRYIEKAERDASPNRFPQTQTPSREKGEEKDEDILRPGTSCSSTATNTSCPPSVKPSSSSLHPTRPSDPESLRHHAPTLSRIHTQRSQHSLTVGGGGGGLGIFRSKFAHSRPLPAFGAGKPYPPPLPSQEDYVVEFDGDDDPLHAQNWALRKKMFTGAMLVRS
jgi:DHA1 family multidrug resistance protein-like MFS transporter